MDAMSHAVIENYLRLRRMKWSETACDVAALVLIIAALVVSLETIRGLHTPYDADHFRDIAQAQTVRDGHPLDDQYYRGEWAWYNPLLSWTLASGSALTATAVEVFHVRAGPWLNLLGPVAFYILGVRLAGRQAALVALALYLFFICGDQPTWACATYSPWLFTDNFSQGVFYASALGLLWADANATVMRASIAGALIGTTFLAHTAPALILAVMACALFATRWRALAIAGVFAVLMASPFLYAIGVHYHFHVLNPTPLTWEYPFVTRAGLPQTLRENALLIGAAVAGLFVLRSRFVGAWVVANVGLLAYAIAPVSPLIPAFHFWVYMTAMLALLAGTTLAWLCPRGRVVVPALTIVLVAWHWPAYVARQDFSGGRKAALSVNSNYVAASRFLRRVAAPDNVVLGTDDAAGHIIGPAGRKAVAVDPVFSNPYVGVEPRRTARDSMIAAVRAQDLETLKSLAQQYGVATVVSVGAQECARASALLPLAGRFGDVCISRLP